ncbi:hypothetical protein P152DRAFT_473937 [Eremomyces bilateralis CBS 781.70]|uniref:Heterokaryon incompatibility domain-containing protein n=1 Tax=Eremomyces bilateralis CBS 781.70 TaxID=1392243 RepID=A0A6G1G2K8_9PEZI|nr:uncharacterized protein P152DRAFT_473937 [Eremomyces bilateralis CBS 781.70]KAF1812222.1 hypothetical protein P152DRAFT_473937 [Eremomyces bilateralis CBS 781.70]
MPVYRYRPLTEGEIRLVRLPDISFTPSTITPEVTIIHTRSDTAKGPFETLSYVWGPNPDRQRIACGDGSFLWGGTNLVSALGFLILRQKREITSSALFWIDALCIYQDDKEEKEVQVAGMRHIYQSAKRTLAYPREPGDDSHLAFVYFHNASAAIAHDFRTRLRSTDLAAEVRKTYYLAVDDSKFMQWAIQLRKSKLFLDCVHACASPDEKLFGPFQPYRTRILTAIASLLARPFFQRIWIVQEMAVSTEVVMVCGQDLCLLTTFQALLEAFRESKVRWDDFANEPTKLEIYKGMTQLSSVNTLRNDRMEGKDGKSLLLLMQGCRTGRATLAVDKIYALLGLTRERFPVEYEMGNLQSVEFKVNVYLRLAKYFIARHEGDNLLYEAARSDLTTADCLSWVPDWEQCPIRTNIGHTMSMMTRWYFDAFGHLKRRDQETPRKSAPDCEMKLSTNNTELVTEGAILQKILIVGSASTG